MLAGDNEQSSCLQTRYHISSKKHPEHLIQISFGRGKFGGLDTYSRGPIILKLIKKNNEDFSKTVRILKEKL